MFLFEKLFYPLYLQLFHKLPQYLITYLLHIISSSSIQSVPRQMQLSAAP